jgi:putative transcriptional regulator
MGERRLKVADVARETGIHRNSLTTLYRDEAERIDVEMIEKLCAFFGCTVGDLLEYVPERRPGKRERAS